MTERLPLELRERWTIRGMQKAHYDAAKAVATIRRGLASFPMHPGFSPLAKRAPMSSSEKRAAQMLVLLAGYAALLRLGIAEHRARAHAGAELEEARKFAKQVGVTDAVALALARRFIASPKNWKPIERIAGEIWHFNCEVAELKKWHAREIGLMVDQCDGRRVPPEAFDRQGLYVPT